MNTRLLGAAVLIALAVLFVPMFFSSEPPAAGGDQSVSLAIPPSPDRDLQTKTMSLTPDGSVAPPGQAGAPAAAPVSSDQLATVDIGSARPRDVELDPEAGKAPVPTTVATGSGASATQPVIPLQTRPEASPAPAKPAPVAAAPKVEPSPAPPAAPKPATQPEPTHTTASTRGDYVLNLSAYASKAGAASLVQRVRALGYPVTSHAITQAGQPRIKVVAGPFDTRTAAEAARLKITQSIAGVPATLEQGGSRPSAAPVNQLPASTSIAKPGGWAVQLAAMSKQADANQLRDKLRANGFDGFVDSVQSGGKQLWRVRAGPQTQRADAQHVHAQIKAKLGIDGNVVSVP